MNKLKNFSYKIIIVILAILITYVTYCSIFNIYRPSIDMKPLIIILEVIVEIFCFIKIRKIIDKIPEKRSNIIAIILCVLFFIGLALAAKYIRIVPGYDSAYIRKEALAMLKNGGNFVNEYYFAKYPKQIPTTILFYNILKIARCFRIDDTTMVLTTVNAAFITLTAFFCYMTVKEIKNYKSGIITILFLMMNPILYLYVSYCYTDTLCMPFAAIAMYLYVLSRKSSNVKKMVCLNFCIGILLAIGYEIRPVIIIPMVAFIIDMFFHKKNYRDIFINGISLISGFLIILFLIGKILPLYNSPKNRNLEFPTEHWLMMGVSKDTDGGWSLQEHNYTFKYSGLDEKKKADKEKIKERLSDLGFSGYIELLKTKLSRTWSNGNYYAYNHLSNFEKNNILYEYVNGNKKVFLIYYEQICKAFILFLLLIAIIKEIRNFNKNYIFIYMSIFGAFLFYLLWESMERYSLSFLPWLALVFDVGIGQLEKVLNIKQMNLISKNEKIACVNIQKTIKITTNTVFSITLCLILINYIPYTKNTNTYYDNIIVQNKSYGDRLNQIATNRIKQSFITKKTFNTICLRLIKYENTSINNIFNFKLYNSKNRILYQTKFKKDDFLNGVNKKFEFDDIKPNGEEEYYFEIYTESGEEKNSIGILAYCNEGYPIYKEGRLFINDVQIKDGSLQFYVQKKTERSYISRKNYILIAVIIIMIELFAFKKRKIT